MANPPPDRASWPAPVLIHHTNPLSDKVAKSNASPISGIPQDVGEKQDRLSPLPQDRLLSTVTDTAHAPPIARQQLNRSQSTGTNANEKEAYSIHGEAAAKRRATAELIFFAGVNDLRRCKQIASTWLINVKDANCMDYDKRAPLHVAAAEGAYSVVQWLIEEGCTVNPFDRHNKTPLEEAVRNDHVELAQLLMKAGGRVWEDGKLVPLDLSRLRGLVNSRTAALREIGFEPEWEVNPQELKLVQRLGGGEFGDVFKAKWHGSYVAAKVLKRSDEIALGDFRTEIAILRKVHHPNCVQFLGACTKQKPYIVITELMACSLADAFNKAVIVPTPRRQDAPPDMGDNVPNPRRQVECALDFARGMAYLHSRRQPIVHRDLKPANMMISGNLHADVEQLYLDSGIIKVADFGLSKSLVPITPGSQKLNMTETYKLTGETGSYRYMAPEVFRHEPYNLRVDVYSFAMIIFQLFEHSVPFAGVDPVEAARSAALVGARPVFPLRNDLTPQALALREMITDCWAPDPDTRPTFEEIIARLEEVLHSMPKHTHYAGSVAQTQCCTVQ